MGIWKNIQYYEYPKYFFRYQENFPDIRNNYFGYPEKLLNANSACYTVCCVSLLLLID